MFSLWQKEVDQLGLSRVEPQDEGTHRDVPQPVANWASLFLGLAMLIGLIRPRGIMSPRN